MKVGIGRVPGAPGLDFETWDTRLTPQTPLSTFNSWNSKSPPNRKPNLPGAPGLAFETWVLPRHQDYAPYPQNIEIKLTPKQEAQLRSLAEHWGKDPGQMVIDAALRVLDEDNRFRTAVREGIEQANRREFIDEEEMDACVERMLRR